MAARKLKQILAKRPVRLIERLFRWCASMQLAIGLVAALAFSLALGTWLESRAGAAVARVHVYQSIWFRGLLTLLAINVMASALIRYPWTWQQAGFVITHIGIEILLAGSLIGSRFGFDAQVHLALGQSASTVEVEQDRLLVAMPGLNGPPVGYEIPLDLWAQTTWDGRWPTGQTLALGDTGAARMSVVGWLSSARSDPQHAGDFVEAPVTPADLPHATKAVCLSIEFGGQQVRRWVAQGSVKAVDMPGGEIRLAYAPAEKGLPFSLTVATVRRANESAGEPVGYATDVVFTALDGAVSRQSVQINHPATFGGVSVFAGPVDETNPAEPRATLDIRTDPGRSLKYLGGALIVAGTIGVFMFGSVENRKRRAKKSADVVDPTLSTSAA
jgi:ResB-like family